MVFLSFCSQHTLSNSFDIGRKASHALASRFHLTSLLHSKQVFCLVITHVYVHPPSPTPPNHWPNAFRHNQIKFSVFWCRSALVKLYFFGPFFAQMRIYYAPLHFIEHSTLGIELKHSCVILLPFSLAFTCKEKKEPF